VDVKMIKRGEIIRISRILCLVLVLFFLINLISAGVGIKWDRESALVNENEKTCLTYQVYNPWPEISNVKIEIYDKSGELNKILTEQEAEEKIIPAHTASNEAIPVEFCFKTVRIYSRDCWIGNSFICKQECNEEQKIYSGEVIVKSLPLPTEIGGAGGSATTMSVSAPLSIKIRCNPHSRDFTLIYLILALISIIVIGIILYKKYRKPSIERDREQLEKLQEKIKKEKRKK
jgi:hypothetical protein